jgi:hypothetical protein
VRVQEQLGLAPQAWIPGVAPLDSRHELLVRLAAREHPADLGVEPRALGLPALLAGRVEHPGGLRGLLVERCQLGLELGDAVGDRHAARAPASTSTARS